MAVSPPKTPMRDWMECHKLSTLYSCVMLTVLVVLQILDMAGVF